MEKIKKIIEGLKKKVLRRLIKNPEDEEIYSRIFLLTWPSFIELFLSSFFGVVDIIMVGAIGSAAIAGVGLTNQPFFLFIAIFSAINVGTTTLVSWAIGAKEQEKVSAVATNAILFNIVVGIILSAVSIFSARSIMGFMTNDELTISYATTYMVIICMSIVFQAVTMCISAIFRGSGQTRIPMVYNIGANMVNILFNYLLIEGRLFFPAMGVAGAAIATSLSRVAACSAAIFAIFIWKKSPLKIKINKGFRPDIKIIKNIFAIGIPAAGEQFVIQSGLMLFSRIISGIAVAAYAAHQIVASVNGMAFSISQAFSISTTALVGQAVGANNYDLAEKLTKKTRWLSRVITGIIALTLAIFGRQITMLYNKELDVLNYATPVFILLALIQFMQSSQMSTAGALRGAGDTMYPFYASILGIWIFRVPVTYLFVEIFKWELVGAWFAFFLDQTSRLVIVNFRFRSGKWKHAKSKKQEKQHKKKDPASNIE